MNRLLDRLFGCAKTLFRVDSNVSKSSTTTGISTTTRRLCARDAPRQLRLQQLRWPPMLRPRCRIFQYADYRTRRWIKEMTSQPKTSLPSDKSSSRTKKMQESWRTPQTQHFRQLRQQEEKKKIFRAETRTKE
ncbi:hypothetical protein V3C99_000851 [Haemonchus contortus]|uniref:Uncharacterized protein n=1 Tax=Haemonchus contortus TaxID=6289 RepID=A0A7I4YFM5_HAECO